MLAAAVILLRVRSMPTQPFAQALKAALKGRAS